MKGSNAPNTVPRSLTPSLLGFCVSIASAEPVFIPSIPIKRAVTSFCFDNVAQRVTEKGGSIAYGWAIWHMPGLYFEAEHHAVWRNKLGNLIDVSPQMAGRKLLMFLSDESAINDPFAVRPKFMAPDGDSERARQMVELGNRRHALLIRCRVPGTAEIRLYEHDQFELAEIDRQIRDVMVGYRPDNDTAPPRRTAGCPSPSRPHDLHGPATAPRSDPIDRPAIHIDASVSSISADRL